MKSKFKIVLYLFLALIVSSLGSQGALSDVKKIPTQCLLSSISFYKKIISPAGAPQCCFYPSCSIYSKNCLEKFGFLKGTWMTFDRLCRCNQENWVYSTTEVNSQIKKVDWYD